MAALKSIPTSANELIFGSEVQEKAEDKNDGRARDEAEKEIEPKEFFWDQLILYIATIIALLTLFDVSIQFLRSGGLFCYVNIPSNENVTEVTRDQAAYINNYCLQDLSLSEYYTVFILIQGILLAAPHYLWSSLFRGQFDFFFDLVRQLDRLRDSNTGEYQPANFEIVKKLEKEFPDRWKWFRIFSLYIVKLILQLVFAIIFIIVNGTVFPESNFAFTFECPENYNSANVPDGWLLPFSVSCVYSSFRVYVKLLIADYFLLFAAIAVSAYGLFWCFRRHTNALGYKEAALFAFTSCLKPDEYVFEPFWSKRCRALFSPRIGNDLDFLLMRLYRADSGHGQVFKDIQVDKELKRYIGKDHELLHLYIDASKDQQITERLQSNASSSGHTSPEPVNEAIHHADNQGGEDQSDEDQSDEDQSGEDSSASNDGESTSTSFWVSLPCMDSGRVGRQSKHRKTSNRNNTDSVPSQHHNQDHSSTRDRDLRSSFFEAGFNQDPEQKAFNLLKGRLGSMKLEQMDSIRNLLFGFFHLAPDNKMAYDISFGTIGYSLILSRAFLHVVSVNFNPFYRNETEVRKKEEFHTNYVTVTFQDDIFSQRRENLTKSDGVIDDEFRGDPPEYKTKQARFVIVGPFTDEAKKVTVNLHIERMKTAEYFHKDAILLTIRPLKIGEVDVSKHFCRYRPPKELSQINKEERKGRTWYTIGKFSLKLFSKSKKAREEMERELKYDEVGRFKGIHVKCSETDCIFEFAVYRFKGKYPPKPVPPNERQRMLDENSPPGNPPPPVGGPPFPPGIQPLIFPGSIPPGLPPFGPLPFGPPDTQKQGSIALVFPVGLLPRLSPMDIERFLSGNSSIQLSAKSGSDPPIRFIFRNPNETERVDQASRPIMEPVQSPQMPPNNEQDDNRNQPQPQLSSGGTIRAEVHPTSQQNVDSPRPCSPTVIVHNGHVSHNNSSQ